MTTSSLIPSTIALIQFARSNFSHLTLYPDWYLGNPYHYLIGPVIPLLATPSSYIFFVFAGLTLTSLGIFVALKKWGQGSRAALFSAVVFLLLPAAYLLLNFDNGLNHIALLAVPLVLMVGRNYQAKVSPLTAILLSIMIAIAILIDSSILLTMIISLAVLLLICQPNHHSGRNIALSVLVILQAISLASLWYTPRYWWLILANPSFGGAPLITVITSTIKHLVDFLPLVLAFWIVKWHRPQAKSSLISFGGLFLGSFLFLTALRFLANPKFILDWLSFLLEVQFGLALLIGPWLDQHWVNNRIKGLFGILCIVMIYIDISILGHLFSNSPQPYQAKILSQLSPVKPTERIFLSGSTVFWLNSQRQVEQVRGGNDPAAINPIWAQSAYQIREGQDANLALDWLTALGAKYLLIHGPASSDPFHDFQYPDKFDQGLDQGRVVKLSSEAGDTVYYLTNSSQARLASSAITAIPKPTSGADRATLQSYTSSLGEPVQLTQLAADRRQLLANPQPSQVIWLAQSFDPDWTISQGHGRLMADSFGNTLIVPSQPGQQQFVLDYQPWPGHIVISLFASLLFGLLILKFNLTYRYIHKLLTKLSVGITEDE